MTGEFAVFFHHRVKGVYEAYLAERASGKAGLMQDITKATDAAKALYHLRERLPATHPKTWDKVVAACPDFALLGEVVNREKHGEWNGKDPRLLTNPNQIEERILVTEYEDEQGVYRHAEKAVLVHPNGAPTRDLGEVLTNVINYWIDELHALGLIQAYPPYTVPDSQQPILRGKANDARIDMGMIRGLEFKQGYQLRRYNYATGRIEPIDITGQQLEFTVYKPRTDLEVEVINNDTGYRASRTVPLSEEEQRQLAALGSKEEQRAYVSKLPQVQAAVEEMKNV